MKEFKKPQTRKCIVSGNLLEKSDLIRLVVSPEKNLIPDIDQSLPGRGYWIESNRFTILIAQKKNFLLRPFKEKIPLVPNIIEIVENLTKKKIISQIALSRKAGLTVFGFEKVKSVLLSKNVGLLIQALDGSDREKKRMPVKNSLNTLNDCLTSAELGKVFGREKVIHCAILKSGFIEKIIFNANRLNNLKKPVPQCSNI